MAYQNILESGSSLVFQPPLGCTLAVNLKTAGEGVALLNLSFSHL